MEITALKLAGRFLGTSEIPGPSHNPAILWFHSLCSLKATADEVPWCSAFVNAIAFLLSLPRTESALARSWLGVGRPVQYIEATPGWDVVILRRGSGDQPGPENRTAPGHVGFFAGADGEHGNVLVLGGNQGNRVSLLPFPARHVLGVRRLHEQ